MTVPALLLIYSAGNNVGNCHICSMSQAVPSVMPSKVARFQLKVATSLHSRQMRKEFINKFGKIADAVKPAVLCYFYLDLF